MMIGLLAALAMVESGGRSLAIGDGGKAYGVLQIHACVVQDVNRLTGSRWTHLDAFDPAKAKEIAGAYLAHYASEDRLGRKPRAEDYARIWNGGPEGHRKRSTDRYWAKVRAHLPNQPFLK
jgi:hypothetical protein